MKLNVKVEYIAIPGSEGGRYMSAPGLETSGYIKRTPKGNIYRACLNGKEGRLIVPLDAKNDGGIYSCIFEE